MTRRATYGQLTSGANRSLAHARAMATQTDLPDAAALADAAAAHADLVAALGHLGHTLHTPTPAGRPSMADGSPRPTPRPRALLAQLETAGLARDWEAPEPTSGCGLALVQAARHTRAAADLLATHRTPAAQERGPESSRLRHPAFLGAANREWRALISATADLGTHLHAVGTQIGADPHKLAPLTEVPRPPAASEPQVATNALEVSVARPAVRTDAGPLVELSDRVEALRHTAWVLAQQQVAPAHVHRNLAAVAVMLNDAAYQANRRVASHDPTRGANALRADSCAAAGDAWRAVTERTASLRSPTTRHGIDLERMRTRDLLARVTDPRTWIDPATVANELTALAESFDQVAHWNSYALRAAHSRGDVYLAGRAIPNQLTADNLQLAAAKLADQPIPAPNHTIRAVDRAYALVGAARAAAHDLVITPPQL